MTPDEDPFGRGGEERTDAFGRPIGEETDAFGRPHPESDEGRRPEGSLWSGQAEQARRASGGFLPPTDAPAESSAWREPARSSSLPPSAAAPAVAAEAASYMERVGAAVIDFFIRAGIAIALVIVVAIASGGGTDATTVALFAGFYLVAPFYGPLAMTRWQGQTIGHRAVKTRIVGRKGEPVTGGRAVVREVGAKYLVIEIIGGAVTFGILTLLNYLWPLWDSRDEALHDKMCDTRVVKA